MEATSVVYILFFRNESHFLRIITDVLTLNSLFFEKYTDRLLKLTMLSINLVTTLKQQCRKIPMCITVITVINSFRQTQNNTASNVFFTEKLYRYVCKKTHIFAQNGEESTDTVLPCNSCLVIFHPNQLMFCLRISILEDVYSALLTVCVREESKRDRCTLSGDPLPFRAKPCILYLLTELSLRQNITSSAALRT